MLRGNSWPRGPREEHTRLGLWFWSLLFLEPCMGSAPTGLENCIIQQTPAQWGALKPLTDIKNTSQEIEITPDPAYRKEKQGRWAKRGGALRLRGESQKVRVWERVKTRKADKSSKSSLNTAVGVLGFQNWPVLGCQMLSFNFFF